MYQNILIILIARSASINTRLRMCCVSKYWYKLLNDNEIVWANERMNIWNWYCPTMCKEEHWLRYIKRLPKDCYILLQLANSSWKTVTSLINPSHLSPLTCQIIIGKTNKQSGSFISYYHGTEYCEKGWFESNELIVTNGMTINKKEVSILKMLLLLDLRCNFKLELL